MEKKEEKGRKRGEEEKGRKRGEEEKSEEKKTKRS